MSAYREPGRKPEPQEPHPCERCIGGHWPHIVELGAALLRRLGDVTERDWFWPAAIVGLALFVAFGIAGVANYFETQRLAQPCEAFTNEPARNVPIRCLPRALP